MALTAGDSWRPSVHWPAIPGERVFRPEFGAGVQRLVFEPNNNALATVLTRRLQSSLQAALQGEVDPKSLHITVGANPDAPEELLVRIDYTLAAIGHPAAFTASICVNP